MEPLLAQSELRSPVAFPPEWRGNAPESEKEIAAYFDAQFSQQFDIYPEVWLKDPTLKRLRVDRVLKERQGRAGGLWAVELKRPLRDNDSFTCFTSSLAQTVDYTRSRIESDIFGTDWFGQQLRFAFVFPCGFHIDEFDRVFRGDACVYHRDAWAQGALKLAGKFGVGAISYSEYRRDWGFFLSGHPVYWLRKGPTDLAQKHAVAIRRGSAR